MSAKSDTSLALATNDRGLSWDTAPRYLLRDRDASFGPAFRDRVRVMGMKEVVTAPRSPWQNPYVERLIGSIRRECLDHIIIFNESHLRRVLSRYFNIITGPGHICHSTRIVRSLAAYSLPLQARLSRSQRSAVYIIAMNVARHDRRARFGVKDRGIFSTVVLTCNRAQNIHSFGGRRRCPRCTDRTRNTYSTIGRRRFQRQIYFEQGQAPTPD